MDLDVDDLPILSRDKCTWRRIDQQIKVESRPAVTSFRPCEQSTIEVMGDLLALTYNFTELLL